MAPEQTTPPPVEKDQSQQQAAAVKTGEGSSKPAVTVNQGAEKRIAEINEMLNNKVLSVDERTKLEAERDQLKGSDAQGATNQRNDDDVKGDDDKKNSFKEDDIIKYMYNEWMIALCCWAGGKIEKAAGTAYARLERRIIEAGIRHRAFVKKAKGTNTYKTYESVSEMRKKTSDEIKKRDHGRLKTVQDIATAIGEGRMTGDSASDVLALAKYMGVDAANVKEDSRTKEIIEMSLRHKAIKDSLYQTLGISTEEVTQNPNLVQQRMKALQKDKGQKELFDNAKRIYTDMVASQKKLCETGGRFALQESRRITFESTLDQSAVLMAEAQMLDAAAKDGKAFAGKDLTEVFKAQTETARASLTQVTEAEKKSYIAGTNLQQINTAAPTGTMPIKTNVMGSIEDYRRRAQRASEASLGNMLHLRFAEIGAKPRENVALANLHTSLTKKKGQLREEEINQDYQRGQQLEEAYAPRPGPRNMNEEASAQAADEQELQARSNNVDHQLEANAARWNQHIASPIAGRIAMLKRAKEKELIAEGARTNFQGWRIASQVKEM